MSKQPTTITSSRQSSELSTSKIQVFKSKLETLSLKELMALCVEQNIGKSGRKEQLITKLLKNFKEGDEEEKVVEEVKESEEIVEEVVEEVKESEEIVEEVKDNEKTFIINDIVIDIRANDGFVNATQFCKAVGKKFNHWYELESTKKLIKTLELQLEKEMLNTGKAVIKNSSDIPSVKVLEVIPGRYGGSMLHPDLFIQLAQHISPKIAIQVREYVSNKPNIKSLQPLTLKENYKLLYRQEDGFVDITDLCKAGDKEFKHWNSIKKTKEFLEELSLVVGIPTSSLIKAGSGGHNSSHTWVHPQVAVNIAQWVSPKFDVLVSKWVFEIMLTGKVDLQEPAKSSQDLLKLQQELLLKDQILLEKTDENKKLYRSLVTIKKKQSYYKLSQGPCVYVIGDIKDEKCVCLNNQKLSKVGYEGTDINVRLQQHRTTMPGSKLHFLIYTEDSEMLEKILLRRYRKMLHNTNHEWVARVDHEKIAEEAVMIVKFLRSDYKIEENIDKYNELLYLLSDVQSAVIEKEEEYDEKLPNSDDEESDEEESIAGDEQKESDEESEEIESEDDPEIKTRKCNECGIVKALTLENFQKVSFGFRKHCRLCSPDALKEKLRVAINEKYHVASPVDLEYHEVKPGTKTKVCSGCQRVLSVEDFHKNKSRSDGYEYLCMNCSSKRKNPEATYRYTMKKPEMSSEQLYCPRCKSVKAKTEFRKHSTRPSGHQAYCRPCANDITRQHNQSKKLKNSI